MDKVYIIAEAGVNHNGSLADARRLVDVAAAAGADAVKFQTFRAEALVSRYAPKARYQLRTTSPHESQFDMIKRLELDPGQHRALIRHCRSRKIAFLSSAFDLESLALLDRLGLRTLKIPSGEITNLPYLRAAGALKKELIVSTGMASLAEVKKAVSLLVAAGTKRKNIVLLQCTSEYPAPFSQAHLRALPVLSAACGVRVGYSDHTPGIEASIAAVALGACVIEKHFTLDKTLQGPDHQASLDPAGLKALVYAVRNVEQALGKPVKQAVSSEKGNLAVVRKSLVASRDIAKGEPFSDENLAAKRPGTGISPMRWDSLVGRKAKKDFRKDELIEL